MKKLGNIFKGDVAIWVVFFILSAVSLVAVYSSIGQMAIEAKESTATQVFARHLAIVLATYIGIILISNIRYQNFFKLSIPAYWLSVILLLVTLFIGKDHRWVHLPLIGTFQPSEVAKVALVIFTARILTQRKSDIESKESFWMSLLPTAIVSVLVLPGNFSTAALIFLSCFIMVRFGGVNPKYWNLTLLIGGGCAILALFIFYQWGDDIQLFRSATWGGRIDRWLHPDYDAINQENMAKMAIARGKFAGAGVGSTVHARLMTQAYNDFIYAIIIEEGGMFWGLIVLMLYATFYFRCIMIAVHCKGLFGALTVAGLGTVIFLQALSNMCVAVGVLPVTGQTLPFISYGGTSYVFLGCSIGVIQSVANYNKQQAKKTQQYESNH